MELFATDLERLAFLLEADAALTLDPDALGTEAAEQSAPEELPPEKRPKYITNYIGSKQKLVDWIWKHTPEGVGTVLDAFSGSAVVAYMYKTKGLQVIANDRLRYCHHAAKAIIENNSVRLGEDEIEALLADNANPATQRRRCTLVRTFTDNTGNKVRYKAEMTGTPLIYPRIHSLGATLS